MEAASQKHGIDVGDLVKVRIDERYPDSGRVGLVKWASERYPPTCGVIIDGSIALYDFRQLEVVSEGR